MNTRPTLLEFMNDATHFRYIKQRGVYPSLIVWIQVIGTIILLKIILLQILVGWIL